MISRKKSKVQLCCLFDEYQTYHFECYQLEFIKRGVNKQQSIQSKFRTKTFVVLSKTQLTEFIAVQLRLLFQFIIQKVTFEFPYPTVVLFFSAVNYFVKGNVEKIKNFPETFVSIVEGL